MMAQRTPKRIRFESATYPGLEISLDGNFAIFGYWETCEVFILENGTARRVASTDVPWVKPELYDHVHELATSYAQTRQDLLARAA